MVVLRDRLLRSTIAVSVTMASFHVYVNCLPVNPTVPIATLLTNVPIACLLSLIVFLNCCEISEKGIRTPN